MSSDPSSPAFDPEELLLHDAFLRSLARGLVGDAQRADDLAQEVWAQVLAKGPREGTRLRAWLAGVARHLASRERRGARRREGRERSVARAELGPSTEAILERERARRDVVRAVLELAEPYRATVLLRYFENLPPRAIARRMQVPVETVRTRTRRGLELLRARLDREHGGDRAAWMAAVAPLAALPPAVPVSAPTLAKVLAMSTTTKVAAGALAAGLLALLWSQWPRPEAPPVEAPLAAGESVEVEIASNDEPSSGDLDEPSEERAAAPALELAATEAPATEPFGSLALRVLWHDRTPAAGVGLQLVPWDVPNPRFRAFDAVTDEDGLVALERVPAGNLGVFPYRGGGPVVNVVAGVEAQHEIVLARGYDVAGRVIDTVGAPVEGADVWLSVEGNDLAGRVVARSDAEGRFSIRSVDDVHWIGARHPERVSSALRQIAAGEGASLDVELVLGEPAGAVEGSVVDARGVPVAGALALVEQGVGALGRGPRPFRAETDADGRFTVRGVAPGEREVVVRAARHGVFRGAVDVLAGRTARVDAVLPEGVTLHGTVADAGGAPLGGVELRVGDHGPMEWSARTAADGTWRLEGLEAGELEVEADGRGRGRASARFHALPGDVLRWDARFEDGRELRGRVQDERGAPLGEWSVRLRGVARPGESTHNDFAFTDADGRFRFTQCPEGPFRLEARSMDMGIFPGASLSGVLPDGGEVLLRVPDRALPSVRLVGRVLDRSGAAAPQAALLPRTPAYYNAPIVNPGADGGFALGPYPPGEWVLEVQLPGEPVLRVGPRELAAGETWEVGTLRFEPPGSLRVRLGRSGEVAERCEIALEQSGRRARLLTFDGSREGFELEELAPGDTVLAVVTGAAATRVPFVVRSGAESVLDVELAPCAEREFLLRVAPDAPWADARVLVTDAAGRTVFDATSRPDVDGACALTSCFAPGRYAARALCADGREARADFEVGEGEQDAPSIELRLD